MKTEKEIRERIKDVEFAYNMSVFMHLNKETQKLYKEEIDILNWVLNKGKENE